MLAESTSPMPKKTRYTSPRSATMDIDLVGPGTPFYRRVPRNLSGADLYRYAFQGMRGQHATFNLRHNGQLITPSQDAIEQQGLQHRSGVYIDLIPQLDQTSRPKLEPGAGASDSEREKLTLIKVYSSRQRELFSYWLPSNKTFRSENLIFRHWRYQAEVGKGFQEYDIDIMTEMRAVGDRQRAGHTTQPWDRIDPSLTPAYGKGILGNEMLYYESGETREETQLSLSHRDALVLKIKVFPHVDQSAKHKIKAKTEKSMSRVGAFDLPVSHS